MRNGVDVGLRARIGETDRLELLLLAAVVIAQAALSWHFASRSFFVADDLVYFEDALTGRFSDAHFLFGIHGSHFSPGRRVATLLIQRYATFDYELTLGFLLAAHSVSVVLVQRILRLLFGAQWWTLAVAFAYGISIVIQNSLQWFSASVLIEPSTMFGLAGIHAYLCWWRTGRRAWLAWSVIAVGAGLLFYIKAILVPFYILLIRVFLLEPDRSFREVARGVTREWPVWIAYAVPVAGALAAYLSQDTQSSVPNLPLSVFRDYFETAWSAGFVPALFGVRLPIRGDSTFHAFAVAGCQLALAAVVVLSILRRRSAWRPWALVVLVFLVNAVLAFPRLSYGADVGYVLRYFSETLYFAVLVIPFAFAVPRAGSAPVGPLVLPRAAVLAPAVAALAIYTAFAWASDAAFTRHWVGRESRHWFANVRGDLNALDREGIAPVILDGGVPSDVLQFWLAPNRHPPANYLSAVFAIFHPGLRFDEVSGRTYRVRKDGHIEAVAFIPAATPARRELCLGTKGHPRSFEWRPREPLRGRQWYLRSAYRTDPAGVPYLKVDRALGYPPTGDLFLVPRPLSGRSLTALGALPTGTPTLSGLRFDVLPGHWACFTRLVVGSYRGRSA